MQVFVLREASRALWSWSRRERMKNRSVECAWEEDPFSKGRRGLREQMACGEWRWQRPLPCSYAVIASRRHAWPNARLLLRAVAHPNRPLRALQVSRGLGRASTQPLLPQRGCARLWRAARAAAPCVDTYVRRFSVLYVLQVPACLLRSCTLLGRRAAGIGTATVRTTCHGTPGGTRACPRPCSPRRSGPSWRASPARAGSSTCASTMIEPRGGCACRQSATARRPRLRCSSSSSSSCSGDPTLALTQPTPNPITIALALTLTSPNSNPCQTATRRGLPRCRHAGNAAAQPDRNGGQLTLTLDPYR